jgi:hypothetical protein
MRFALYMGPKINASRNYRMRQFFLNFEVVSWSKSSQITPCEDTTKHESVNVKLS